MSDKKLLVAYLWGQLTAYGMTVTEDTVVNSLKNGFQADVTPEEVREVMDDLIKMKALKEAEPAPCVHNRDRLPYG